MHVELVVRGGDEEGCRYLVHLGERLLVGRSSKSDIRLTHTRVSRRHVALTLTAGGLYVTDLGSHNGTRVAGQTLTPRERVLVPRGRSVHVGPYRLETQLIDSSPEEQERTRMWRASDARAVPPGYELTTLVGSGGQSRVWAARHRESGREVAVKILRSRADEEDRLRFEREGQLAKRVTSPFVVEAYETGVADGRPYLVMELVHGTSLNRILRKGAIPLHLAVRLSEDLAQALDAAHRLDVIHRDVKPGNVLITAAGHAKLSDFGMAKLIQSQALTQTGVGLGSLPYVPPEQAMEARDADARSDLYGLGTTIFHMVAGEPPFPPPGERPSADDLRIVLEAIVYERARDLSQLCPECPAALSQLVAQLLAKDPNERPTSATEVAEALARVRREHSPRPQDPTATDTHEHLPVIDSGDGPA
jgi:serine/threonine-protein kinase